LRVGERSAECPHAWRRDGVKPLGLAASFPRRLAEARSKVALTLHAVESDVHGAAGDVAVCASLDLFTYGDRVPHVAEAEDGEQDELLEVAESMRSHGRCKRVREKE
jgi:hypothetical protein